MPRCLRRLDLCLLMSLIGLAAGCSDGAEAPKLPPLVPVSGTVLMDGNPLADATVTFLPEAATDAFRGPMGRTDAAGKFELSSDVGGGKQAKGAAVGKYKVVVSKFIKADGTPFPPDSKEAPMNVGARESIPMQYTSPTESPFVRDVPQGGGTMDPLELKSEAAG